MSQTNILAECPELSQELKKILAEAKLVKFTDLTKLTQLSLMSLAPKLKVRHLSDLNHELSIRKLNFVSDDSIKLDKFINQRKLFNLWQQKIDTYQKLDKVPFEDFVNFMGGPQSRFTRNKVEAKRWMEINGLSTKKRFELPHLSKQTAELLYKGGIKSLKEVVKESDYDLAMILQSDFGHTKAKLKPLTRARIVEIKYALYKAGITRPFTPL